LVVHEADPRSIRSVHIFKDEKVAPPVETASLNPVS
jgi:putative hemolysin